jgi:condensation enzyme
MTELAHPPAADRFPISSTQETLLLTDHGDDTGTLGSGWTIVEALRITGEIDLRMFQDALNDVVARHEILRTVLVRDIDPPCQQVYPPCPVPLRVIELPPAPGESRSIQAEELMRAAERARLSPRKVPLLRAILGRFDARDWVLILVAHHSACDGWSMELIIRDLAVFYAARVADRPPVLPPVSQYREFAAREADNARSPEMASHLEYWTEKLRSARSLALPADRPVPDVPARAASGYEIIIDAQTMSKVYELAKTMRCSAFMVVLSALNVLAYQITGKSGWAITTITSGRNDPQFHDTVGPIMNFMPLCTDITGCESYREVIKRTRAASIEAYSHEIPMRYIERAAPELNDLVKDPGNGGFLLGIFQPQFEESALQIAERSHVIREFELPRDVPDFGGGVIVLTADFRASGEFYIVDMFNTDEWNQSTISGWMTDLRRILVAMANQPDMPPALTAPDGELPGGLTL